jgi:hypothetical protein
MKRVAGSFPEPSSFGIYSCMLLGFWSSLWMQRYQPRLSGPLAFCTLVAMLLSTSSTAYGALTILLSLLLIGDLSAFFLNREPRRLVFIVVVSPILLFLALAATLVMPTVADAVLGTLGETVFNKANTVSAIQRSLWNSQAWQNFIDSYGMGIGIGSTRASSYLFVLLGNVGLIGTVAYVVFTYKVLSRAHFHPSTDEEHAVGTACRWAFGGSLIANAISAGVFELGTQTYLAAAAAAAIGYRDACKIRRLTSLQQG